MDCVPVDGGEEGEWVGRKEGEGEETRVILRMKGRQSLSVVSMSIAHTVGEYPLG